MKIKYSVPLVLILLLAPVGPAAADFVVRDVQAHLAEQDLRISTRIEIILSEQVELAIESGVPLVMLTEFELQGKGVIWKRTLMESRVRRQLRYHSLADRYVVEDLEKGEIDIFTTVNDALTSMGVLGEQVFAVPAEVIPRDQGYTLAVRSRLDINRLPAALRPLAFFSPSWRLSSDWTRWQVKIR